MQKHYHLSFSGMVQGVGFRYTACLLAEKYNIKGWVENIAGGGVEMEAEGDESDLRQFLSQLQDNFKAGIAHVQTNEIAAFAGYDDFRIKRHHTY